MKPVNKNFHLKRSSRPDLGKTWVAFAISRKVHDVTRLNLENKQCGWRISEETQGL